MATPHLDAGEDVAQGLDRIAGALVEPMLERIRGTATDVAADVHDTRTTCKRLRALWRLVGPVVDETEAKQQDEHLRDAARRLSTLRDATVARDTLGQLSEGTSWQPDQESFELLLDRFVASGLTEQPSAGQQERALHAAAHTLAASRQALAGLALRESGFAAVEPGLRRTYQRARQRMRALREGGHDEIYHDWRKRVKYLFYQVQVLQAVVPRLAKLAQQLKQLQVLLGEDHDLVMLAQYLHREPQRYGDPEALRRVTGSIDARCREIRGLSRALGERLFRRKPRRFTARVGAKWHTHA